MKSEGNRGRDQSGVGGNDGGRITELGKQRGRGEDRGKGKKGRKKRGREEMWRGQRRN